MVFVIQGFPLPSSPSAEAFAASLRDVLRLAEAVLCRLTGDAWQDQSLPGPCEAGERERHSGFIHGDMDASSAQVTLWNLSKRVRLEYIFTDDVFLTTVFISDCDETGSSFPGSR